MKKLRLYADGSSHAKGGLPIGWAWILTEERDNGVHEQLAYWPLAAGTGSLAAGTNNVAELSGIRDGLGRIWCAYSDFEPVGSIEVCSDSMYALGAASGQNAVHSNVELVREIRHMVTGLQKLGGLKITFSWVRGHAGEDWQERCDRLAVKAKEDMKAKLAAEKP